MKFLTLIALLALASFSACVLQPKRIRFISKHSARTDKIGPIKDFRFLQLNDKQESLHPYLTADFQRKLDQISNSKLTANNKLKLLPNKSGFFEKIRLINEAKQSIHFVTHQIVCDEGGKYFTDSLIKAKKRGIEVLLFIEGSFWGQFGKGCIEKLQANHVTLRRSHKYLFPKNWSMNIHDKILVTDLKYAITGGQNIGSWWANSNGQDKNFRDTDVLVEGPIVLEMLEVFIGLWEQAEENRSEKRDFKALKSKISTLKSAHAKKQEIDTKNYTIWLKKNHQQGLCRFVHQEPFNDTHFLLDTYIFLTKHAQRQVLLQTPRLDAFSSKRNILFRDSLAALAAKPSTSVGIVTNGPGFIGTNMIGAPFSHLYAWSSLDQVYQTIDGTKLKIFLYNHWMHAKIYYFDGIITSVGSLNFDYTNLFNSESALICIDKKLTQETQDLFLKDMIYSKMLNSEG